MTIYRAVLRGERDGTTDMKVYVFPSAITPFSETDARAIIGEAKGISERDNTTSWFRLGFVWGNEGKRILDLYHYLGKEPNSEHNPEIRLMIYEDGIYQPERRELCGDSIIILAAEELHRRLFDTDRFRTTFPNISLSGRTICTILK
jgi:hypothetical protein